MLTAVAPNIGSTLGGTAVTITGNGLSDATAVTFGTVAAASFSVISDTQITATSPPGTAGTVDVTVTSQGGVSAVGTADPFTYRQPRRLHRSGQPDHGPPWRLFWQEPST